MKRRVFYSFHYETDNWRAAQVRNIGAIEGNRPATDNDWEVVKQRGDVAIRRWIADQMDGRSCTVVLVGTNTANRKWINHEIVESWKQGMGVVGIYIHGLKDVERRTARAGDNPFDYVELPKRGLLSAAVPMGVRQPGLGWGPLSSAVFGNAHRQAPTGVGQPGSGLGLFVGNKRRMDLLSSAVFGNAHRQVPMGVRQPGPGLDPLSPAMFGKRARSSANECPPTPTGFGSAVAGSAWLPQARARLAVTVRKRAFGGAANHARAARAIRSRQVLRTDRTE